MDVLHNRRRHGRHVARNGRSYHNNDGFGFHEYLQFAEDLGAEPPVSGREIVLTGPDLNAGNSFDNPSNVAPVEMKLDKVGNSFTYVVKPYLFTVLRLVPQESSFAKVQGSRSVFKASIDGRRWRLFTLGCGSGTAVDIGLPRPMRTSHI